MTSNIPTSQLNKQNLKIDPDLLILALNRQPLDPNFIPPTPTQADLDHTNSVMALWAAGGWGDSDDQLESNSENVS